MHERSALIKKIINFVSEVKMIEDSYTILLVYIFMFVHFVVEIVGTLKVRLGITKLI